MDRGGCGRAPDSNHTGTRCSRRTARRAAARSATSSPSEEEMNTRTRWSGVKITSVSAITSQASPRLVVTKITDAGLAGSGPEAIPRILRAEGACIVPGCRAVFAAVA